MLRHDPIEWRCREPPARGSSIRDLVVDTDIPPVARAVAGLGVLHDHPMLAATADDEAAEKRGAVSSCRRARPSETVRLQPGLVAQVLFPRDVRGEAIRHAGLPLLWRKERRSA